MYNLDAAEAVQFLNTPITSGRIKEIMTKILTVAVTATFDSCSLFTGCNTSLHTLTFQHTHGRVSSLDSLFHGTKQKVWIF